MYYQLELFGRYELAQQTLVQPSVKVQVDTDKTHLPKQYHVVFGHLIKTLLYLMWCYFLKTFYERFECYTWLLWCMRLVIDKVD